MASKHLIGKQGEQALVGVIMGSGSDWETMKHCSELLETLGIPHEVEVVSAHRTPDKLFSYAEQAESRGIEVIVAGAGGAAHLPGMVASKSYLPVLGVPVQSRSLNGMDSLLSIAQMPAGVPVGTMAISNPGATNAGIVAAPISANKYPQIKQQSPKIRDAQTKRDVKNSDPRQVKK